MIVLLFLTIGLLLAIAWNSHALRRSMDEMARSLSALVERVTRMELNQIEEGVLSTTRTWTSGGAPHTHTVTKGDSDHPNETQSQYDRRCIEEFAAQQAIYPPD